jgi:hypothetical protein
MSDSRFAPLTLELITNYMNELAREIGMMDPNDPRWATVLKELAHVTQLRRAVRFATDEVAEQGIDELAREIATLKPGDPRRKQIVGEIMRLAGSKES